MTAQEDLHGTTAIVTGASRGIGREISIGLRAAGATVVGVARGGDDLEKLRAELGDGFIPVVADAADTAAADTAARLLTEHRPRTLVLNAGALPVSGEISSLTWEEFSRHWDVDVRQAFHWIQQALRLPMPAGSTVIAVSSGAAVAGSPMSGGYAGAKATVRFAAGYGADESERRGLGIEFVSVLPGLTAGGAVGDIGIATYAARAGVSESDFLAGYGSVPALPEVGRLIAGLALDPGPNGSAYRITADGLTTI